MFRAKKNNVFKRGDNIICVNTKKIKNELFFGGTENLKMYEVYTVYIDSGEYLILTDLYEYIFSKKRFISLIEYRKIKLKKLRKI